jgi:hypothetical protein
MAIPESAFDKNVYGRTRTALAADRKELEPPRRGREFSRLVDTFTRLSTRIGNEIYVAVAAKSQKARMVIGGGARASALVQGDYHSACRLRTIARRLLAAFDPANFRASHLMHRKSGLWRLAPWGEPQKARGASSSTYRSESRPSRPGRVACCGGGELTDSTSLPASRLRTQPEETNRCRRATFERRCGQ